MANNITNIYFSNTFGDLVRTANNLVNAWQYLGFYDWDKPSGTFSISSTGTGFLANTTSIFRRETRVEGFGSSLYVQNNAEIGKILSLTDRANNVTLYSNGVSLFSGGNQNYVTYLNSIGYENSNNRYAIITTAKSLFANSVDILQTANVDLIQSNNQIIYYNLSGNTAQFSSNVTVGNLVSNNYIYAANNISTNRNLFVALNSYTIGSTVTNNLQANNVANTSYLSVTNDAYANNIQANNNVYIDNNLFVALNSYTIGSTVTNNLQANNVANTSYLSVTNDSYTNNVQANSSVRTNIITANTRVVSNSIQANNVANTSYLSVTNDSYTNNVQANSSVRTNIITANTRVVSALVQANNIVLSNTISANSLVTTKTLNSESNTFTNYLQANSNILTEGITANSIIRTTTLQANSVVNSQILYVSQNNISQIIYSNTDIICSRNANSNNSYIFGTLFANTVGGLDGSGNPITYALNSKNSLFQQTTITNRLTVAGDLTVVGTTTYEGNSLKLSSNTPSWFANVVNIPAEIRVNRTYDGSNNIWYSSNADAALSWSETNKRWRTVNVVSSLSNTNPIYTNILVSDDIGDNFSDTSSSRIPSSRVTNILYNIAISANANTIVTQGVDNTQNTNITNLNTWLASNVSLQAGINVTQNTQISLRQGVDNTQNASIIVIQGVDNTQNTNITNLNSWLASNVSLQAGINSTQNTQISLIQGVDNTQNTNITNLNTWLASNVSLQSGINSTQNTSISNLTTFSEFGRIHANSAFIQANSAYNQANSAQTHAASAFSKANTSITVNGSTGLSVSGSPVGLGGTLTLTNSGVTSLSGTTNRVTVSGATGAITITAPQDIHTTASPTFSGLTLSTLSTTSRYTATGNQASASLGVATGSLGGIEIQGPNNTSAAFVAFHRPGAYATYFGLGTNNRLQIGGWSGGGTAYNIPYSTLGITFDNTDQAGTPGRVWGSSNDGTTWYEYNPANFSVSYASSAGSVTWGNVSGKPFNYSGQPGQPSWLWGTTDGVNYYVWNPSNFSVNYSTTAGNSNAANGYTFNQWLRTENSPTFAGLTVGTGASSSITMQDTDEGARTIHCNSHLIGFLNQAGGWGSYCDDSGNWYSVGNVTAAGNVVSNSDKKLKKNVTTIENALSKVMNLRGVNFEKIADSSKGIGLIAQEVQKIIPEVVVEDKEGTLSVAYGNIVGVLIEAIKEQQKQIDELKFKIGN